MDRHRLGIIIPFRGRHQQLSELQTSFENYFSDREIDYRIIIVEQDDAKLFNRGFLLNIGFTIADKLGCNYVVFHDVDMLPVDVDYSYSNTPLHLATDFVIDASEKPRELFEEYFGGVTLFPSETFKKINGYSNKYWGWGFEDTDLLLRCSEKNVELDTMKMVNVGNNGQVLKFNGIDSYVECKNIINLNKNLTISATFHPEKLHLNHQSESDTFTVFSIPGWDFSISYNSFCRYNFCTFDELSNVLYVNSKIKTNYRTNITVTIDREINTIKVYQDGNLIGVIEKFEGLYKKYDSKKNFYLGVGNPNREGDPNFFKGEISFFAYFDKVLTDNEVKEITNKLPESVLLHYDSTNIENYKLKDLTGNGNDGRIVKCEIVESVLDNVKEVKIPFRRKSLFKSLKHEENGFHQNKWKHQATRWNQLRFINEVSYNNELLENDGLSTTEFILHDKLKRGRITHLRIGI
jgi:predicted glycosyltransferase involved in capsule biosynthesis